jgi:putative hydrolase of the HAD superfamily
MLVDVLLFDLGGVLVEVSGLEVWRAWRGGQRSDEALWAEWLASPAVRRFDSGRIDAARFAQEMIVEFSLSVTEREFLAEFENWIQGLYPGVLQLLSRLRRTHRVACLSNTNELHWSQLMNDMGLRDAFDAHFASHELGEVKPDPRAFELTCNALGTAPERVLFLDDNDINVQAARRTGMHAERVLGVEGARAALQQRGLLDER